MFIKVKLFTLLLFCSLISFSQSKVVYVLVVMYNIENQ